MVYRLCSYKEDLNLTVVSTGSVIRRDTDTERQSGRIRLRMLESGLRTKGVGREK